VTGPDDLPSDPEVQDMAQHVDHEMERLLRIGELQRRWGCLLRWSPFDIVSRGLRVAYAGHGRALLEFFHDGRLDTNGQRKRRARRQDGDIDVQLYDYTRRPLGTHAWTPDHLDRLGDADKLLAHVSTGRLAPARAHLPEWGDVEDRHRFRQIIERVLAEVPDPARLFPATHRAFAETR